MFLRRALAEGTPAAVISRSARTPVAESYLAPRLNAYAQAGGVAREGGDRGYYAIDSVDEVRQAFRRLHEAVGRCHFDVVGALPAGALHLQHEVLGTLTQDRDHRDGWDWAPAIPGRLRIYGPTCDRVLGTPGALALVSPELCSP